MKLEAEFHAANVFWQEARERVLGRAHFLCVPLELKEHDDEFLYDLFDNGATIPTDEQIDKALRELFQETIQGAHNRFPCYVCTMKGRGTDTPRCARYKECHLWLNWAKQNSVILEVKPQAPYQAEDASVQPPAVTAEDIRVLIKRHNTTVDKIKQVAVNVTVDGWLFKGMEIWHAVACEGADIVSLARRFEIDVVCDMQTGEIILK